MNIQPPPPPINALVSPLRWTSHAPLSHDLAGVVLPQQFWKSSQQPERDYWCRIGDKKFREGRWGIGGNLEPNSDQRLCYRCRMHTPRNRWSTCRTSPRRVRKTCSWDDPSCSKTRRSSLFHILTEGFLLPPLPISQGKHGLEYGENKCRNTFLSVFANLAMNK